MNQQACRVNQLSSNKRNNKVIDSSPSRIFELSVEAVSLRLLASLETKAWTNCFGTYFVQLEPLYSIQLRLNGL